MALAALAQRMAQMVPVDVVGRLGGQHAHFDGVVGRPV